MLSLQQCWPPNIRHTKYASDAPIALRLRSFWSVSTYFCQSIALLGPFVSERSLAPPLCCHCSSAGLPTSATPSMRLTHRLHFAYAHLWSVSTYFCQSIALLGPFVSERSLAPPLCCHCSSAGLPTSATPSMRLTHRLHFAYAHSGQYQPTSANRLHYSGLLSLERSLAPPLCCHCSSAGLPTSATPSMRLTHRLHFAYAHSGQYQPTSANRLHYSGLLSLSAHLHLHCAVIAAVLASQHPPHQVCV